MAHVCMCGWPWRAEACIASIGGKGRGYHRVWHFLRGRIKQCVDAVPISFFLFVKPTFPTCFFRLQWLFFFLLNAHRLRPQSWPQRRPDPPSPPEMRCALHRPPCIAMGLSGVYAVVRPRAGEKRSWVGRGGGWSCEVSGAGCPSTMECARLVGRDGGGNRGEKLQIRADFATDEGD